MEEPITIFENSDFVVVNKPAGLMVHAARVKAGRRVDGARANEPTLADWLVARYPEMRRVGDDPATRPGIVHRLDKATSGVMIAARTQAAFERLKKLFQEHCMEKTYYAVVRGIPRAHTGVIDAPIGMKSGSLKRSIHAKTMVKPAVTEYAVEKIFNAGSERACALLKVMPRTGRTHQIRVHLASIGHPIVGDAMYGKVPGPRLMLHAASLAFDDGAGNRFEFEAPLPPSFVTYPQAPREQ